MEFNGHWLEVVFFPAPWKNRDFQKIRNSGNGCLMNMKTILDPNILDLGDYTPIFEIFDRKHPDPEKFLIPQPTVVRAYQTVVSKPYYYDFCITIHYTRCICIFASSSFDRLAARFFGDVFSLPTDFAWLRRFLLLLNTHFYVQHQTCHIRKRTRLEKYLKMKL